MSYSVSVPSDVPMSIRYINGGSPSSSSQSDKKHHKGGQRPSTKGSPKKVSKKNNFISTCVTNGNSPCDKSLNSNSRSESSCSDTKHTSSSDSKCTSGSSSQSKCSCSSCTSGSKPSSSSSSSSSKHSTSSSSSSSSKPSTSSSSSSCSSKPSTTVSFTSSSNSSFSCSPSSDSSSSSSSSSSSKSSCSSSSKSCSSTSKDKCCHKSSGSSGSGEVVILKSIVSPLVNLCDVISGGCHVCFTFRRKNKVCTMQWSAFQGTIPENGRPYVVLNQTVCNMPPYPLDLPYRLIHNDNAKMSFIQVNPHSPEQIRFYLDISGLGKCVSAGDFLVFPGGAVSWITEL